MSEQDKLQEIKNTFFNVFDSKSVGKEYTADRLKFELNKFRWMKWLIEQLEQAKAEAVNYRNEANNERLLSAEIVTEREDLYLKVEQQQREIERMRTALQWYAADVVYSPDVVKNWQPITPVLEDRGAKARSVLNYTVLTLSPNKEQTPPTGEMSHNDKFQLDYLINEFGADFILDYVNDYAHREVSTDGIQR